MIHFAFLMSRQGKIRLSKWYTAFPKKEQTKILKELSNMILHRSPRWCNVLEWKEYKIVYRRYASLFFVMCVDNEENELLTLEVIHHYVEVLDKYFGNVCELDLIFNFHKAYFFLDEIVIAGEFQEANKRSILRIVGTEDAMAEEIQNNSSIKDL